MCVCAYVADEDLKQANASDELVSQVGRAVGVGAPPRLAGYGSRRRSVCVLVCVCVCVAVRFQAS
jgi:hypothetical protein